MRRAHYIERVVNDWKRRLHARAGKKPAALEILDDYVDSGAPTPTTSEILDTVHNIIEGAQAQGFSPKFARSLQKLICADFKDVWRMQLSADAVGRLTPMHIEFDEAKFPRNISQRRYNPEQNAFLRKAIPDMVRSGILEELVGLFAVPLFCPSKPDGIPTK